MNLCDFVTTAFGPDIEFIRRFAAFDADSFGLTVGELRVAELQVLARPGRVVLRAHGVLHALDVLLEVVERAEDVLHALAVVQEGGVGLHVAGALGLLGRLDGQRLDDLARRTLGERGETERSSEEFHAKSSALGLRALLEHFCACDALILTGGPGGPIEPESPLGPAGP